MSLRVVFDTSTLVGAAIRPDSIPDQTVQRAIESHELFSSAEAMEELERVLKRDRLNHYTNLEERMQFYQTIQNVTTRIPISESDLNAVRGCCRDLTDEKFLAICVVAGADILVSSDYDLLVLDPWRGVRVLTPNQFLAEAEK